VKKMVEVKIEQVGVEELRKWQWRVKKFGE
jgi:hypothetical protein